ncbi:MAG: hypothetical protein N2037_06775 [Acidimicrobiales bacterium]|nr:hypothetical protein [Acidimicrobiales bacterium]
MVNVVDCDQHLFEPPDLWARYIDPVHRDSALRLDEDVLGYTWLWWRDQQIALAFHQVPGDTQAVGGQLRRLRDGQPAEYSYAEMVPADYTDPRARLRRLDELGIDATMVFPNNGLVWERRLSADLAALLANMAAWNRWAGEVAADGAGRLFPVVHLSLRDLDWLDRQLAAAATAGVRVRLMAKAGDLFMFCSDYPHSEGTADPRGDYRRTCPAASEPDVAPGLFGANAAWLLGH